MTWWILQSTLMAGVMAAIIGLACRLRRVSPALQHALWLFVLLKLLTPPVLVWPWRLPDLTALAGSRPAPEAFRPDVPGPEALSPLAAPPREPPAETAEGRAIIEGSTAALVPDEAVESVEDDADLLAVAPAPAKKRAPVRLRKADLVKGDDAPM